MRHASRVALLAVLAGGIVPSAAIAQNQAFVYTGQPQSFTVPANISAVTFTVEGAQGGALGGAAGAKVVSTVSTSPGTVYELTVGGGGTYGFVFEGPGQAGGGAGFNGGGGAQAANVGGGGGASDVRVGTCAASLSCGIGSRSIIAGGGGGADSCGTTNTGVGGQNGGNGSTVIGSTGYGLGGSGAIQAGGGAAGAAGAGGSPAATAGTGGTFGQGGAGGAGGESFDEQANEGVFGCDGGGGGGGLYGGGGGGGGAGPPGGAIESIPGGGGGGGSSLGPNGSTYLSGGGRVTGVCNNDAGQCVGADGEILVQYSQATTTTLTASDKTPLTGETVTYTATVTTNSGTPTGPVAFKDGAAAIPGCGSVTLGANGTAQCQQTYSTANQQHAITAAYGGDGNFQPSTSSEVDVTASAPAAALQVTPSSYVFPDQFVGGPSLGVPFKVTNDGSASTTIGPDAQHLWGISGNDLNDFPTTGGTCQEGTVLNPGDSCTIGIVFDPTNTGPRSAALSIEYSGNQSLQIPLSGTATAAQISPHSGAELGFGNVAVGTQSAPEAVSISNPGDANLQLGALSLSGSSAGEFALSGDLCTNQTIGPGGQCTVDVTARPTGAGVAGVTLNVPNNAYTTVQGGSAEAVGTVLLTFNMTATAPVIKVTPSAPAFGDQLIGTPSAAKTVTITNTGSAPLHVGQLSVTNANANATDFAQSSDTCSNTTVAVSAGCTTQITFTPGAAGSRGATLQVPSDAGSGTTSVGMTAVTLTGNGTTTPDRMLTISTTGSGQGTVTGGSLSCPGTCSGSFANGTAVTLTAVAAAGSRFAGWSGDCSGTGACKLTLDADQSVTASFTKIAGTSPPACTLTAGKPQNAKHRRPRIALVVRCDQAAQVTLTGRLKATVITKHGRKQHRRRRSFRVSSVTGSAVAATSLTLTVPVPQRALRLLSSHARESVVFTLTATNANGRATAAARLGLKGTRRHINTRPIAP
jgi:hypothetical protein